MRLLPLLLGIRNNRIARGLRDRVWPQASSHDHSGLLGNSGVDMGFRETVLLATTDPNQTESGKVSHTCNSSIQEAEAGGYGKFEACLVYIVIID